MIDRDPTAPHPDPKIEDARLQPDPELQMSGGTRASTAQIVLTAIGAIAVITLVLFGLNNQRDEAAQNPTASAPSTQTTGAAPSASPPDAKQQDAQKQQGGQKAGQANNQDAKPGQQDGQANQPSGQAQNEKGSGGASSRNTTGAAPSPPTGTPESSQSSTGGARSGQ
jgi:cytoskeletal protein RodZ